MDFGQMLRNEVSRIRHEEYASKSIRTLGEVILLLETQPLTNIVKLDFTDDNPCALCSYRGYYEDLSIDHDSGAGETTVKQLLEMFEEAVGKTYTGYKGGDFTMNRRTLVWVAPWGSTGRMLSDVKEENGVTIICTQDEDD